MLYNPNYTVFTFTKVNSAIVKLAAFLRHI